MDAHLATAVGVYPRLALEVTTTCYSPEASDSARRDGGPALAVNALVSISSRFIVGCAGRGGASGAGAAACGAGGGGGDAGAACWGSSGIGPVSLR